MTKELIIKNLKIEKLNEMQLTSIQAASTNDITLLAPTGSGKTLAFLFPLLARLKKDTKGVQALILTPSRELALQIEQVWKQMSTGYKTLCCYGGHATKTEKNSFNEPPTLLIGTPGRITYHIRNENFDTSKIKSLVLDEFDKSLEFGFHDEMSFILENLSNLSRRILTSATKLNEIPNFVQLAENAIEVNFLKADEHIPRIDIKAVSTTAEDKVETLLSLICYIGNKPTLVFCNHRDAVNRISETLEDNGIDHGIFHGGMEQVDREKALLQFRNGSYHLLICTDLASRGLDIPEIACIIHFQLGNEETFIHRNGRTARMQAEGTAFLILNEGKFPEYLKAVPLTTLPDKNIVPPATEWITLYIAAGKKDKINKIDIVGLFLQKGKLSKDDLGRIEVHDKSAYAAVKRNKVKQLLQLLSTEKIKNKKVKIGIVE
jgi:superfamily II DNA/RNA helicase